MIHFFLLSILLSIIVNAVGGPDRIPVFGKLPGDFVLTFAGGRIRVLVPVGSLFLLAFLISLFSRRWR